jgi:hypothetical protein
MKGLKKYKPRAVNSNARVCSAPITNTTNTNIKVDTITEQFQQEEIVPVNENQEEKKSTKSQTTYKPSKHNR